MSAKQSRNVDDLVRRIADSLPQGMAQLNEDLRRNLKEVISAALSRMDLVTREEFDVQSAVLARTREKLERLEAQVEALEKGGAKGPAGRSDADG